MSNSVTLDGSVQDSWFICMSQMEKDSALSDAHTSFYSVGIVDNLVSYTVHYIYEEWSQCVAARTNSITAARFFIAESSQEYIGNSVYIKIVDLNFANGDYTIKTSEPFLSLEYVSGYYYTVGA